MNNEPDMPPFMPKPIEGSSTADLPRSYLANAMLSWAAHPSDNWSDPPIPGVPYKAGGWQPETGWDCSGAFGSVMAGQLGMRNLPGVPIGWYAKMPYHPGPALDYLTWKALWTVAKADASVIIPGDVIVWETHIGVGLGPNLMVSALSPVYGTCVTPVLGWGPDSNFLVRRLGWKLYSDIPETANKAWTAGHILYGGR